MKIHLLAFTCNIRKAEEVKGQYSKAVHELLDDGWSFKGDMQSHMQIDFSVKPHDFWLTLVQEFVRED